MQVAAEAFGLCLRNQTSVWLEAGTALYATPAGFNLRQAQPLARPQHEQQQQQQQSQAPPEEDRNE